LQRAVPIPLACGTQARPEFSEVEPLNGKRSTACPERKLGQSPNAFQGAATRRRVSAAIN